VSTTRLKNQIHELTTNKIKPFIANVYKESLKELLSIFGSLHYFDGNNNKVRVKATYGSPERIASRAKADNTLILPLISVVESGTDNSDKRLRYRPVLINETFWDSKKLRATRVLSFPPRPINLSYEINIWSKYKADMDMLRSSIFGKFNPEVNVRTRYSDFNKCFIESEQDLGSVVAQDSQDRVLQKSINVTLETYIPSPKFTVTNTGEIVSFHHEVVINNEDNSRLEVRETGTDNLTKIIKD
tara:strand:+ start:1640 stop:2371 length:732 start_codon:yes stop_codon:yes gene_type:complete